MALTDQWEAGDEFTIDRAYGPNRKYKVTDVGSRVVVAVEITVDRASDGWLIGPPYAVVEQVFDEEDQKVMRGLRTGEREKDQ